jgi:hypothetical protein
MQRMQIFFAGRSCQAYRACLSSLTYSFARTTSCGPRAGQRYVLRAWRTCYEIGMIGEYAAGHFFRRCMS